jgi:hypothetical protein
MPDPNRDSVIGSSDAPAMESSLSAVSWPAIIAGAFVAASTTLILFALGSGLGLAMVSPWPNAGASVTTFGIVAGIGLIVVQWVSSGLGGWITGRLRTKWARLHTHEVFFRDTAHGLLTWALATVVGGFLIASAAGMAAGTGVNAAATVAGGAAHGASQAATSGAAAAFDSRAYDVDTLFRTDQPNAAPSANDSHAEAMRILAKGALDGDVAAADRTYLAQLISTRAGISQADAQKRVDAVVAQEQAATVKLREAANTARKAASAFSIFTALSLIIGAFIACAAAALGGSQRDEHA